VPAELGHPPAAAVDDGGDTAGSKHLAKPGQLDELVLMAAASGPATIAPQQVTVDGRHHKALSGVGVAHGVVQHLLVAPPGGRCTRVASPSTHTTSPLAAISTSRSRTSASVVTKVPSGWQNPSAASLPSSRSMLSPTSVLEIPTMRLARRYDSPASSTAATASRRTSRASGGVPPCPRGRGGRPGAGGGAACAA
jgi:hypothetical protein